MRAVRLNYAATKKVTVSTSASSPALLTVNSGHLQVRINNYDTVRVAFVFGGNAASNSACPNADLTLHPTIQPGATEVFTVNAVGGEIWFSIVGDTGATGKTFEMTICEGI